MAPPDKSLSEGRSGLLFGLVRGKRKCCGPVDSNAVVSEWLWRLPDAP